MKKATGAYMQFTVAIVIFILLLANNAAIAAEKLPYGPKLHEFIHYGMTKEQLLKAAEERYYPMSLSYNKELDALVQEGFVLKDEYFTAYYFLERGKIDYIAFVSNDGAIDTLLGLDVMLKLGYFAVLTEIDGEIFDWIVEEKIDPQTASKRAMSFLCKYFFSKNIRWLLVPREELRKFSKISRAADDFFKFADSSLVLVTFESFFDKKEFTSITLKLPKFSKRELPKEWVKAVSYKGLLPALPKSEKDIVDAFVGKVTAESGAPLKVRSIVKENEESRDTEYELINTNGGKITFITSLNAQNPNAIIVQNNTCGGELNYLRALASIITPSIGSKGIDTILEEMQFSCDSPPKRSIGVIRMGVVYLWDATRKCFHIFVS